MLNEEGTPMKAIAYTSDVTMHRTKEVISRATQKEVINKYAAENGIEIAAWFEDEVCDENVFGRPGAQKMMGALNGCDMVLVERVWSFSRNVPVVEKVCDELEKKGVRLEAASTLWDVASQKCRHRFKAVVPGTAAVKVAAARRAPAAAKIRKPEKLNFLILEPTPVPA
jgi:DNA invertase Pin-like site-specific DNA recombinase